jgi:p-aminobenzoyl-glutamate transporter AbgT
MSEEINSNADNKKIPYAVLSGCVLGITYILIETLNDYNNLRKVGENQWYLSLISMVATFAALFLAIKWEGERNKNGFSTYKSSLWAGTIVSAITSFIYSAFVYGFYLQRPAALESMMEEQIKALGKYIQDEDKLDEYAERIHEGTTAFGTSVSSFFVYFILLFIFALIVAAFQKSIVKNYQEKDIFSQ